MTATAVVLCCASAPVEAQLPDPTALDRIVNGGQVLAAAGLTAAAGLSDTSVALSGDASTVLSWTRSGWDGIEGLRGPRWTNRWGARVELRGSSGEAGGSRELEERLEIALWAGSVGQTLRWETPARLTDLFWQPGAGRFSIGAFADIPGLGLVDDGFSCEGFPFVIDVTQHLTTDATPGNLGRTTSFELAMVRVASADGDLRLVNHRLVIRDQPSGSGGRQMALRAVLWDIDLLSADHVFGRSDSAWSWSGHVGVSMLSPFKPRAEDLFEEGPVSVIPLIRVGIAHRARPRLRLHRSEIGRPLVDETDFGIDLGTAHRLVEDAGLDAGGQLRLWFSRSVGAGVAVHGETLAGLARRRFRPQSEGVWVDSPGWVAPVRAEAGIDAELAYGMGLEARIWLEYSDRIDPLAPIRWQSGVQGGLRWQL
jgi:hypothetical protein